MLESSGFMGDLREEVSLLERGRDSELDTRLLYWLGVLSGSHRCGYCFGTHHADP
jgi:hypothetical protein